MRRALKLEGGNATMGTEAKRTGPASEVPGANISRYAPRHQSRVQY